MMDLNPRTPYEALVPHHKPKFPQKMNQHLSPISDGNTRILYGDSRSCERNIVYGNKTASKEDNTSRKD
jgi:hypothetical protein